MPKPKTDKPKAAPKPKANRLKATFWPADGSKHQMDASHYSNAHMLALYVFAVGSYSEDQVGRIKVILDEEQKEADPITIECEESNGRDDQHYGYRVLRDGKPVSGWLWWSEANEIADRLRKADKA